MTSAIPPTPPPSAVAGASSVVADAPPAVALAPPAGSAALGRGAAFALLGVLILVWGVNWPIMKVGLGHMTPFWFSGLRLALASAVLFAVLAARRELIVPPRADWPIVISIGLLQLGVYVAGVHYAIGLIPAGRTSVLSYTFPIFVVPAAILLLGEKLTALKIAGLALGLAGIVVLFDPFAAAGAGRDTLVGNAVLLVSAAAWAAAIVHIRRHRFRATTLQLAPWSLAIGAAPLLAVALLVEGPGGFVSGARGWLILAYNGVAASAFGFWAMISINRALPAITTSLGVLGVPALGIVSSAVALGEALTPSLVGGALLVGLGLAAVALAEARRAR